MFTLTDKAKKELEAFFADKEPATVRIYLAPGGCSGPMLALALDDANEDDQKLEAEGFSFCINKELFEKTGALTMDILYEGFVITPEHSLGGGGCSGCGGGCSH